MTTTSIRRNGEIHVSGWFGHKAESGKGITVSERSHWLHHAAYVLGRPAGKVAR